MSPVGRGVLSLTKFYLLRELVEELANVAPGMTHDQVQDVLGVMHTQLHDDVVLYDAGEAVDDPLLQACRSRSPSAHALLWVALVMADYRLANIVEKYLTGADGKLVAERFNADRLEAALDEVAPGTGGRKTATNVLSYYRDSSLVVPLTHGGSIVGIESTADTSPFVRDVVRYVMFRLQHEQLPHPVDRDDADVALAVGANHWLNLTPEEFRAAYDGTPPDVVGSPPPPPLPPEGTPEPPPVATEVAVEANNTESYEVSGQTTRTAVRREQALVRDYMAWMEARESEIVRFKLRPPGTPAHLYNDIFDKTRGNLIEGKADASRPSIRMAIGQLMDYRRFAPDGVRLAVLTKRRPHADLEALLGSLGIACVWREGDAFVDNAEGAFV